MASEEHRPIPILFRNDNLVVVNKPAGLLVHRSRISSDTVFLLQLLKKQLGCMVFPVHRLDRPTSGLMVLGLHQEANSLLNQAFRQGEVEKGYLAVVRGWLHEGAVIDSPLRKEGKGELQEAVTAYVPLARTEFPWPSAGFSTSRYSLLKITPKTGRYHQIRRHMAHIRHPVVGDTMHGDGIHNRYFREKLSIRRLLLQACSLAFREPETGEEMSFTLEPERCFAEAMQCSRSDLLFDQ